MNIRIFLILFLILFLQGCRKNKTNPVPNIPFDLNIDIGLPGYNALNGVGGWCFVNGGSRGIIVYRKTIDEFVAFDRHAPSDPNGTCSVPLYPSPNNFLELIDSCNNSSFSLYDGTPISNSEFGLRQYMTAFDGNSLLRIYN